ncbi:hypothetical protein PoB_001108400 [Plakobranchus ocellatus]|uniref:Uncharacterized protein n=1 Tax=Plakobranchus ocellatus TaxID=259542 RepID=A0AAV3YRH1_9GAST|nr:hypothetical protein PoB_001108400 [Plakobranchus ocellatus]
MGRASPCQKPRKWTIDLAPGPGFLSHCAEALELNTPRASAELPGVLTRHIHAGSGGGKRGSAEIKQQVDEAKYRPYNNRRHTQTPHSDCAGATRIDRRCRQAEKT